MKTPWKIIDVCNECLNTKIRVFWSGTRYCKKCGNTGIQPVLMRRNISFFKIKKEYKRFLNYANPFED